MNTILQKYSNTIESRLYLASNTMLLSRCEGLQIVHRLVPAGILVLRCFFNNKHILRAQESSEVVYKGSLL